MARRSNSKARIASLGDVLRLLRIRRRPIHSVVIHPDGALEVRLAPPSEIDVNEVEPADEIERWLREHAEL